MLEQPLAKERILIVDDDAQVLTLLQRILAREGYRCTSAGDAEGAGAHLDRAPFDLLLALGALSRRRHELDAQEELKASREETVQRLCIAVEARDPDTATHISQMSEYCDRVARELGLPRDHCDLIRTASAMHDVGKIGIPDSILLKPGRLTPDERLVMERHAEIGYRILVGSRSDLLQLAAVIAWTHHEKFDGSGYPRGLSGHAIPLEGRIVAVADVFDALTRDRVYRARLSRDQALDILEEGRGAHFDPQVLDAFLTVLDAAGVGV